MLCGDYSVLLCVVCDESLNPLSNFHEVWYRNSLQKVVGKGAFHANLFSESRTLFKDVNWMLSNFSTRCGRWG